MNKKQKYILIFGIILILVVLIFWFTQGAEIFTKTQVIVDNTTDLDRMLGVENKKYADKFVFGFFPSGISELSILVSVSTVSGLIILSSGIFIYLFKNKRKETI